MPDGFVMQRAEAFGNLAADVDTEGQISPISLSHPLVLEAGVALDGFELCDGEPAGYQFHNALGGASARPPVIASHAELRCHSDELCEAPGVHLPHHLSSMDL
jgi:hypothetical protein